MSDDMTAVIIPKSDQISADDLIAGPRTLTIAGVTIRPGTEQPVDIHMQGEERLWRPCKSMSRVLVDAWGPDAKAYTGRSLTLYRDPAVKWGGLEVGGIRISHMSHLDARRVLVLTVTKGSKKPFVVQPLKGAPAPQKAAQREENGHSDDPDDQPPPEVAEYDIEQAELELADVCDVPSAQACYRRIRAASREATGDAAREWGSLLARAEEKGTVMKAAAA